MAFPAAAAVAASLLPNAGVVGTVVGVGAMGTQYVQSKNIHQMAYAQDKKHHHAELDEAKKHHDAELKKADDLHLIEIAKADELHFKEIKATHHLHRQQITQALKHHSHTIKVSYEAARRENLRDVWVQKGRKADTLLINATLMFGCLIALLCEGNPPEETPEWVMVLWSLMLAACFMSLSLCITLIRVTIKRMSSFNIYNPDEIYSCKHAKHKNFETFYQCQIEEMSQYSEVLFTIGNISLVILGGITISARLWLLYDSRAGACITIAGSAATVVLSELAQRFYKSTVRDPAHGSVEPSDLVENTRDDSYFIGSNSSPLLDKIRKIVLEHRPFMVSKFENVGKMNGYARGNAGRLVGNGRAAQYRVVEVAPPGRVTALRIWGPVTEHVDGEHNSVVEVGDNGNGLCRFKMLSLKPAPWSRHQFLTLLDAEYRGRPDDPEWKASILGLVNRAKHVFGEAEGGQSHVPSAAHDHGYTGPVETAARPCVVCKQDFRRGDKTLCLTRFLGLVKFLEAATDESELLSDCVSPFVDDHRRVVMAEAVATSSTI